MNWGSGGNGPVKVTFLFQRSVKNTYEHIFRRNATLYVHQLVENAVVCTSSEASAASLKKAQSRKGRRRVHKFWELCGSFVGGAHVVLRRRTAGSTPHWAHLTLRCAIRLMTFYLCFVVLLGEWKWLRNSVCQIDRDLGVESCFVVDLSVIFRIDIIGTI